MAAAGIGLFVWLATAGFGGMLWFEGLFLALIAGGLSYAVGVWLGCDGAEDYQMPLHPMPATLISEPAEVQPEPPPRVEPPIPAEPPQVAEPAPAPPAPEPQMAATDVASEKAVPPPAIPVTAEPVATITEAEPPVAKVKKVKKDKADKKKAKDKKPKKEKAEKPKKVRKVKALPPDDLKQIKGVGPKLEQLLNENGVTRFAQVADWRDADVDRFAELIGRMGGRIRSDDWVTQARILADGGATRILPRAAKGEVSE
ncbi:MAG: hypothetical protein Q4G49_04525 [Paracoccus sp. (in: a-proteobacteria)]|nr:hypothetical protein [Paracoccus sp. (in: a-proteobacteria)]